MTGFHDVNFPARLKFNVSGGPEMRVDVTRLSSGHERRNKRWSAPLRRYLISVGQRPLDEIQVLTAFFEARSGPLYGFRFRDPFEHSTAALNQNVSANDVEIGIGDGVATEMNLILGNGRQVTHPIEDSLRVAVDGVEIFTGFSFDQSSKKLVFDQAPASEEAISAGFQFDVPVRFENEQLVATRTVNNAGEVSDITLLELRF
ncbi:DUF2460 domain-containing protein [Ahrensia marina]|uniref:DUF2460 domain-containing protein n=1 Tax=Ahrensia marina TaxID=1514904 RepID=A0A0M9GP05_9HYPH|nr:DUF2460 domain-containing protein [Ahrensia marina]KPB02280.1 hypothetical protein SU32_03140 [Ahrensia marina]